MSLRLYELATSRPTERSNDSASVTRKYIAMYSASETAVYRAALLVAGPRFDGLRRQRIKCDPQGGGVWLVEVEYSFSNQTTDDGDDKQEPPGDKPLGPEFSFDTSAQQVHITQSLGTNYRQAPADRIAFGTNLVVDGSNNLKVTPDGYAPAGGDVGRVVAIEAAPPTWTGGLFTVGAVGGGQWTLSGSPAAVSSAGGRWGLFASGIGTAASYKSAIGVTNDRVEGVDVFAPKLEFSEVWPRAMVNLAYVKTLRYLTGRTNVATFRGFAAGEVLYLGGTGQASAAPDSGPYPWKVTHKFSVGENLYDVVVSSVLGVPAKKAWEYLWCAYKNDVNVNQWVQTATAAYVERVYKEGDFSNLEIGA